MSIVIRSPIQAELLRARKITDRLFAQVLPEALYDRAIPERHRIIFYIGHLDAFDWNIIGRGVLGLEPSTDLDVLFAFGIDPASGELPHDEPEDWPSLFEIHRYVKAVRANLDRADVFVPERAMRMAIEHRLMHAETLTYLIHNLPYSRRLTRMRSLRADSASPPLQFVRIPAGIATLGMSRRAQFGWDNEFDLHARQVDAFAISKYKVTNQQYLEFVQEGGSPPHYWINRDGKWRYRGFEGEVPLPRDFPVFVSYAQADAFARWKGKALPTEEQFHRAAFGALQAERLFPWGNEYRTGSGNYDFCNGDVVSVTANASGDSGFGVSQLVGNGWEWTSTIFAPFPGFEPDPLYPTYSANFFDGEHHVLKGASCATDHMLLRRSFRNWFRSHYGYAYTTFRLVEN